MNKIEIFGNGFILDSGKGRRKAEIRTFQSKE